MAVPNLTYVVSHKKRNPTTGSADTETFTSLSEISVIRCSYNSPYNFVTVTYTTDIPLIYYEVRSTLVSADDYGIGVGTRLYYEQGNISSGHSSTFNITVNKANFPTENTTYRIGLYAKSSDSDGYWDVKYLLFTSDNEMYATSDYDGVILKDNQPIPSA